MTRKMEILTQEVLLAVINQNTGRAEKLIRQMPREVVEKVAYGSYELLQLTLRSLPGVAAQEIQEKMEDESASSAAA